MVTMKMTDHRALAVYTRYSTVDAEDGKAAAAKLARLLAAKTNLLQNLLQQRKKGHAK
jgi:hypothetical protein